MSTKVTLPELGENITGGTIAKVMVAVGDAVQKEQSILEVETDKAVVEVPTPHAGTVAEINVKDGDQINIGDVILSVAEGDAAPAPVAETPAPEVEAPTPEPKVTEPEPKPTPAPVAAPPPPAAPEATAPPTEHTGAVRPAPPSVRRLAREIGVDVNQVVPADGQRITLEDIKAHAKGVTAAPQASAPAASSSVEPAGPSSLPDFTRYGEIERQNMSKIREVTARRLTEAWETIPHVTQNDKADITDLDIFRKKYGAMAAAKGGKLTATAILVKVMAMALERFPQFNASIDFENNQIVYKKYFNIGVAVDTDRGLLVPVLKNVDKKGVIDIAAELGDISERARTRKLKIEEMQGGSITITNLGGIGGVNFTPIVNPPEVAIMGVSRGRMEPVYIDGEFVPRMLMPLSLSYDHRLIDGADAARFTRWVCEALESPLLLIMD